MIKYGLKLWTSNSWTAFQSARRLLTEGLFHFIELYHNPGGPISEESLAAIDGLAITIHHTHNLGWHEMKIGEEQLAMWQGSAHLAHRLQSEVIVVHPGQAQNLKAFVQELAKFDDPRIYLENMSGLDINGHDVFARTLPELRALSKLKPICFDLEKAVKSAAWQKIDYREFIHDCLIELRPTYFHISGGDKDNPIDEHRDLRDANFDVAWIARQLSELARSQDVRLVFETPKDADTLDNDRVNLEFFRCAGG